MGMDNNSDITCWFLNSSRDTMNDMDCALCPKCDKMFAVDCVENDDVNYLSPCCRVPVGKL